jgi:hypothetical protein
MYRLLQLPFPCLCRSHLERCALPEKGFIGGELQRATCEAAMRLATQPLLVQKSDVWAAIFR